jgi:hypothetical protein
MADKGKAVRPQAEISAAGQRAMLDKGLQAAMTQPLVKAILQLEKCLIAPLVNGEPLSTRRIEVGLNELQRRVEEELKNCRSQTYGHYVLMLLECVVNQFVPVFFPAESKVEALEGTSCQFLGIIGHLIVRVERHFADSKEESSSDPKHEKMMTDCYQRMIRNVVKSFAQRMSSICICQN